MTITSSLSESGDVLTIAVSGRFDFSSHLDFCESYKRLDAPPKKYCIDMDDAAYIDSSALGMLLLLHDYAGDDGNIEIINANNDIKEILSISNFEQLFSIA